MSTIRFSISRLMAVVGVVALNLAVARWLVAYDVILLVAVMPTALLMQAALFGLIRTRGRRRAFWAGFLAAGALAMLSFVWAIRFSGSVGVAINAATGKNVTVVVPGSLGGDQVLAVWEGYVHGVYRSLPGLPQSPLMMAVVLLLPQLLAALACGLLARLVKRRAEVLSGV